MAVRGLFIGIDRYLDVTIPWLGGAEKDARALHALFSDSFADGEFMLLTGEAATRQGILGALDQLAKTAGHSDQIFVMYAGHGTEDHRLVCYDADRTNIEASCISLTDLGNLLSSIPGETLACFLDCCFSGGIGSRVFSTGLRARGSTISSIDERLRSFLSKGRIAFTASADNEESLESARHGHGLFTFRLIQALQGVDEVQEHDRINLIRLIEYVTRHVQADAAQQHRVQTPTLRGQLDGVPMWPILIPGTKYGELFPERVRQPASEDPKSLVSFGIAPELVNCWTGSIEQLNSLQLAAVNEYGVLDGENVVVTAPTSSGKTLIGELAALQAATSRGRAVFLLPMKALVADKYDQFKRTYEPAGLRIIRATGDYADQVPDLLRGRFDIALLTYEKFGSMVMGNPAILHMCSVVVVDEAQILADEGRGSALEFLLTLVNNRRGETGSPQIITLSAVVGDLGGLDRWLGARNLHSNQRPVPLVEGVLQGDGSLHHLDEAGNEQLTDRFVEPYPHSGSRRLLISLARRLLEEGKKLIVFRTTRPASVACAVYLSQALPGSPATDVVQRIVAGDVSGSTQTLERTLQAGVAFHNSDLSRDERVAIEESFRDPDSPLRVIVATPTLAMGVNTPAAAVAIVGLERSYPPPPTPYAVSEYKNMVGRAGRLGFNERGESYLIPEGTLSASRAWTHYVKGELEALQSQLVPDGDPRSLILRVFAAYPAEVSGLVTREDVIRFLDSSFAAFQAREGGSAQWDVEELERYFDQLERAGLLEADVDGYRMTALGRFAGQGGVHVDSIVRLSFGLRGVSKLNAPSLIAATQLTNELQSIPMPAAPAAKNTEVPRWPSLLRQQQVPYSLVAALQTSAPDQAEALRRAKRAAAAIMWIAGTPMARIEQELLRHMPRSSGASGPARTTAERTRDLLPAVAAVLREVDPETDYSRLLERTMVRLELGIPAELCDLVMSSNAELSRTQWLKLHEAGLDSVERVLETSEEDLTNLLGQEAAHALIHACQNVKNLPSEPVIELPLPSE